nr:MAG TPA: hypothetical protein [Caudoviricetes sp.]
MLIYSIKLAEALGCSIIGLLSIYSITLKE